MFGRPKKSEEEKVLEKLKKKKEKLDKIKGEMNEMGKLIIKDGKLVDSDKVKQQEVIDVEPVQQPSTPPPVPPPIQPMPAQQPQAIPDDVLQQMREQAMYDRQIMEEQRRIQMENALQQQQNLAATIVVTLINGMEIPIEVSLENMDACIGALDEAIENHSVFDKGGNGKINAHHIAFYSF